MNPRLIPSTVVMVTACAVALGGAAPAGAAPPAESAATQAAAKKPPKPKNPAGLSKALRREVTRQGVDEHLRAFQRIAEANDGNRASGTPGYAASRDYVVQRLRKAGYKPRVQAFDFPFYTENEPSTLAQVSPDPTTYTAADFSTMTYSGSGDVEAKVSAVDTDLTPRDDSTSGCEASDFAGFTAGDVALLQRGTCAFGDKAKNAEDAGASAVIIVNRGTPNNTDAPAGTLGAPGYSIPVLAGSTALGKDLIDPAGTVVTIGTDTTSEIRKTYNVTADSAYGNPDKVVVAGAHLDSVTEGPGINDNGSGSATLLENAEALAKVGKNGRIRNKVRFAWWGAEELGLLGAEHYVADLADSDPAGLQDIQLYLNFDMVGSTNFVRFVYDGDNSSFGEADGALPAPEGSGTIEQVFADYFTSQKLATAPTAFDGRSDYGPFIDAGIPSGGLFTGAEGTKTAAEAAEFGGTAGEPYDPCYHQTCDDLSNISSTAIDQMSDAVAHSLARFATDLGGIPERKAAVQAAQTAKALSKKGRAQRAAKAQEKVLR